MLSVDGRAFPQAELTARQLGLWKRVPMVMETGHPSTRAVNLGSGNRAYQAELMWVVYYIK